MPPVCSIAPAAAVKVNADVDTELVSVMSPVVAVSAATPLAVTVSKVNSGAKIVRLSPEAVIGPVKLLSGPANVMSAGDPLFVAEIVVVDPISS